MLGKRIFLKRNMPEKSLVERFSNIPASNIGDVMERNCGMNPRIKLMSSPKKNIIAGPAYTVKCRAGDNLGIHAALNYCQEGDVLVVSNEEDSTRALIGEIMMSYLFDYKKIAALVVDGPIRDLDEVGKWDYHIYATGTTPAGPYKEGPFEINVPISAGGVSVNPGDIVVVDNDGIVVVPLKDAKDIIDKAEDFKIKDEAKLEKSRTGSTNRQWVNDLLEKKEYKIIDDIY